MAAPFHNNVVLLTGASMGIGEQLAYQLAGQGARLMLAARSADRLEQVVAECRARGGHAVVAEAAVIGVPDEVRGNVIYAYCLLRAGFQGSDELVDKLKEHIKNEIGPIAQPSKIEFVSILPKTRSGKIMRRVLKARAMGLPEGDTSTLEE